eukprot:TRINITY_DN3028_c0_g1_i1.p1 TRINITY_DN3028_c0_g1~~TRINITY_DN3028_c0_g1_i1.p1  ORF type:complete len:1097 (+),score=269.14 TRINITY_DN3028_c0_g1_i1:55-3291(+)
MAHIPRGSASKEPVTSGLVKVAPPAAAPELRLLSARTAENCIELIKYIKNLSEVLSKASTMMGESLKDSLLQITKRLLSTFSRQMKNLSLRNHLLSAELALSITPAIRFALDKMTELVLRAKENLVFAIRHANTYIELNSPGVDDRAEFDASMKKVLADIKEIVGQNRRFRGGLGDVADDLPRETPLPKTLEPSPRFSATSSTPPSPSPSPSPSSTPPQGVAPSPSSSPSSSSPPLPISPSPSTETGPSPRAGTPPVSPSSGSVIPAPSRPMMSSPHKAPPASFRQANQHRGSGPRHNRVISSTSQSSESERSGGSAGGGFRGGQIPRVAAAVSNDAVARRPSLTRRAPIRANSYDPKNDVDNRPTRRTLKKTLTSPSQVSPPEAALLAVAGAGAVSSSPFLNNVKQSSIPPSSTSLPQIFESGGRAAKGDVVAEFKTFTIHLDAVAKTKKVVVFTPDRLLLEVLKAIVFNRDLKLEEREARLLGGSVIEDLNVPLKTLGVNQISFYIKAVPAISVSVAGGSSAAPVTESPLNRFKLGARQNNKRRFSGFITVEDIQSGSPVSNAVVLATPNFTVDIPSDTLDTAVMKVIDDDYENDFYPKAHINFLGMKEEKAVCLISMQRSPQPHFSAISSYVDMGTAYEALLVDKHGHYRFQVSSISLQTAVSKQKETELILEDMLNSRVPTRDIQFHYVSHPDVPEDLLSLNKKHSQKVTKFKTAVLYVLPGQTDLMEIFKNQPPPESDFWKFLDSIADKVNLSGWTQYRGDFGSDSNEDTYFTVWKGIEMMFHIAPWFIPEQHRRLIGNDICFILYYDNPKYEAMDSSAIASLGTVPQVFAVVQPAPPTEGDSMFRLGFLNRQNLKPFGPRTPPSTYLFDLENMKDYLFTRLHNGFAMAMTCPPMNRLFETPRAASIEDIGEKYPREKRKHIRRLDKEKKRALRMERRDTSSSQDLVVRVMSGKNLVSRDANGLSDPYVILTLVDQKEKSNVVKKSLNPEWGAEFTFSLIGVDPAQEHVNLTVMDWDRFSSHDYMGEVDIPLSSLVRNGQTKPATYKLISKTGAVVSGEVEVAFSYIAVKSQK